MATERLPMRKTREILRQKWELGRTHRPIVGEETIADSVCDRLIHNAHKVRLVGESIRKAKGSLTPDPKTAK